jgi:ankyrin repeat protein
LEYTFGEQNVNATFHDKKSLLMIAATNSLECVKFLLNKGADPNYIGEDGFNALLCACKFQKPEIIDMVIF